LIQWVLKIMRSVWSLTAAIAALILLAFSPVAFCQQSDRGNITELENQWEALNATMTSLSQDMSSFDRANATINYSREQVDGIWFNVTSYTAKDGTIFKEYLDADNQTNRTTFVVPETLLTTMAAEKKDAVLTILASPIPCQWILTKKSTGGYPIIFELYNPCRLQKFTYTQEADGTRTYAYQDYTKKTDNTYVVVIHPDGKIERYVETRPGVPPECKWCSNTHQYECVEKKST
jgi:hypothetical protein